MPATEVKHSANRLNQPPGYNAASVISYLSLHFDLHSWCDRKSSKLCSFKVPVSKASFGSFPLTKQSSCVTRHSRILAHMLMRMCIHYHMPSLRNYTCIDTHTKPHTHTHAHTHTCASIHASTSTGTRTYTHTHMRTHTHMHPRTHTRVVRMQAPKPTHPASHRTRRLGLCLVPPRQGLGAHNELTPPRQAAQERHPGHPGSQAPTTSSRHPQ